MEPLKDLLVLDFSTLLPGPMATLLLAEAGAEVIKIERPPFGDDMRRYDPPWGDYGATFALLNRGKQSLALDLKSPDAGKRLRALLERADVLIEQFRPGVMTRLGFGYDAVAGINPRLIYCSISAYGQTGPKRDHIGHDINAMAETGLLALAAGNAAEPAMPPTPIADIAGGSYPAVINILLALRERDRTGRGCHLDMAICDNLFALSYWALAQGWAGKAFPGERDSIVTGGSPRYRLYTARDRKIVAAAPLEDKFWSNFCELIGLGTPLREDARDPAATAAAVAAIIASEDGATWAARFATHECCCTVAVSLAEALANPQFRERGVFAHRLANQRGQEIPALPVPLDSAFRNPIGPPKSAPLLGSVGERAPCEERAADR